VAAGGGHDEARAELDEVFVALEAAVEADRADAVVRGVRTDRSTDDSFTPSTCCWPTRGF